MEISKSIMTSSFTFIFRLIAQNLLDSIAPEAVFVDY